LRCATDCGIFAASNVQKTINLKLKKNDNLQSSNRKF